MSSEAKLGFGVEFELLLKPKLNFLMRLETQFPRWAERLESAKEAEKAAKDQSVEQREQAKADMELVRKHFRSTIASILTDSFDIITKVNSSSFQEWSVVDEVALDEITEYCRVEFVSRAMPTNEPWKHEFDRLFDFLNEYCWIQHTKGCSTHVHVSLSAKPRGSEDHWSTQHLNKIMKALSYFDDPITSIMPSDRKNNPWAASNMSFKEVDEKNKKLSKLSKLSAFYEQVEQKTWKPLFDHYDAELKTTLHWREAHKIMGEHRYVSWNFEHVTDACGTIEFRRSPSVGTAKSAKRWASFTLGFISAAALQDSLDWTQIAATNAHPPVDALRSFVQNGIEGLEDTCHGALGIIKEDHSEPRRWSAAELQGFIEKKAMLESCVDADSYVQKYSRTPEGTPTGSPNSTPHSSPSGPSGPSDAQNLHDNEQETG